MLFNPGYVLLGFASILSNMEESVQMLKADEQPIGCFAGPHEDLRLSALDDLDLLDTPREEAFDRIARLVRFIFKVPIALVSLMDGHRQWHKAWVGTEGIGAERKDTFCRYPIASGEPLVISDARTDPRVSDNPYVVGPNGIRFYAGVPLITPDGLAIGTVCAIDLKPRKFSHEELGVLRDVGDIVMHEIELRQLASTDALTGLLSRRAFKEHASRAAKLATRHKHSLSCIAIDIDHFKRINDTHGHAAGDEVLKAVSAVCKETLRATDFLGRLGGEEFAALLPETSQEGALDAAEKLRCAIERVKVRLGNVTLRVTASLGVAALEPYSGDMDLLLAYADEALYAAKNSGRNRTVVWQGAKADRRKVLKAGRIIFNDRRSIADCTIRSLGTHSAGIGVWNPQEVPDRFTLAISANGGEQDCKVTARADKHVEVDFI